MSKSTKVAIVATAVALAYPASAWWLGGRIEAGYEQQYQQFGGVPYLKVVDRDYQRGVFDSTATATFELSEEWLKSLAATSHDMSREELDSLSSARVTLRSSIKHGPLPGGSPGAGTADVELVFEEKTRAAIEEVLGDKPPLHMRVMFGFDGGGVATASSPAFEYSETEPASGVARTLAWGGATLLMKFSRDWDRYTLHMDMPSFDMREGDGHVQFSGIKVSGDLQRVFADEPLFYAGSMQIALARASAVGFEEEGDYGGKDDDAAHDEPVRVEDLVYDVVAPLSGEFMDLNIRLGARVFQVGDQDYGPAHYDVSLSRIHARTAARLHRILVETYRDAEVQAAAAIAPSVLFKPLAEPALSLLQHDPELRLERISFNSAYGSAQIAARAKFNDLKPEDIDNPFALLFKLDASGEFSLPLGLIEELQQSMAESGQQAQERSMMFNRQLEAMVGQGYIHREGGSIRSKIAYKGGQLTVNDLPFNPLAMGVAR